MSEEKDRKDERKILVVDDDEGFLTGIKYSLSKHLEGWQIRTTNSPKKAKEIFKVERFPVILCDLAMPDISVGFELIEFFKSEDRFAKVIVITAHGEREWALEAVKRGVFDFFEKPLENDDFVKLAISVERAFKMRMLETELWQFTQDFFEGMVGVSPQMKHVFSLITRVAPLDVPCLIEGESGTGKELVARAIHKLSPRSSGPFIPINCTAIPESLIESELFGYEKGAFTGAYSSREGKIVLANGGTLLLDEIGDTNVDFQAKLLRVIEEGVVWPVGAKQPRKINVRFLFATNKDLRKLVEEGKFREDLYHRISTIVIKIPPLRERREDVIAIAHYYLKVFSQKYGKEIVGFAPDAIAFLNSYDFPGNVRELKNMIERAVAITTDRLIRKADLTGELFGAEAPQSAEAGKGTVAELVEKGYKLDDIISSVEREAVLHALEKAQGNIKKASQILGISRPRLYFLLKKYNIRY